MLLDNLMVRLILQLTYLLVHVSLDFRSLSFANLDPADVKGVHYALHLRNITPRCSSESEDSKVRMMGCNVCQDGGVRI